ncbi:hypothetical protein J3R30DRAFT_3286787 [Lentinula aciculospora]|uniref:Uncharacterized protein n=1 Tax=Lentinula aciculospora TaxID=153920 RepID=A0A9W9DQZ0_9AGAR|nr:hypothetical protein J3R30DRAFT_3286787 [Lentinula aciculospora]
MLLVLSLALNSWILACVQAATPAIISPANGTRVAPGAPFAFKYQSTADYAVSSYNYTVVLYTEQPKFFADSLDYAAGYTFGQFDVPNYPAVPYAHHPAPPYFIMPDFSQRPGGWGVGASISNATFYLAVFEEYSNGKPRVGRRISLSINNIVYNGTDRDEEYLPFCLE